MRINWIRAVLLSLYDGRRKFDITKEISELEDILWGLKSEDLKVNPLDIEELEKLKEYVNERCISVDPSLQSGKSRPDSN